MQIFDQSQLLHGWIEWRDQPSRFTAGQMEIYESSGLSSVSIVNRCAGMKLEFETELKEVILSFQCDHFLRRSVCFDCYEDGNYQQTFSFPDGTGQGSFICHKTTASRAKFEIYLPHACDAMIERLDAEALRCPDRPGANYLALGDSITQGLDAKRPSFTYPVLLARRMGWELLNQGVGGYVFDSRVIQPLASFVPDIITVAYGVNDCWLISTGEKRFEEIEREAAQCFERLADCYPKAQIYVVTPIPWALERFVPHRENMRRLRDILTCLASEMRFPVIDGETLVPPAQAYYAPDGTHPNENGFFMYAEKLQRQMQK